MIRGLLFFCIFLIIGSITYQVLEEGSSSYLLIVWNKTSIEMNLWFSLLIIFSVIFLMWLVSTILRGSFNSVKYTKQKIFGVGDGKAQAKTVDGLIDFIEENWALARKKLTQSASEVKAPTINYLAAARSAYELGDEQGALELLHKAETSTNRGGLAIALTQARMQFSNMQYEQTLATLARASSIRAEHPVVLNLRLQVYTQLKDWTELKKLLPILSKNNTISADKLVEVELNLYRSQLNEQIKKLSSLPLDEKKAALNKIWAEIPTKIQHREEILFVYASQLMTLAEHDSAEKCLSSALVKQWFDQWIDLYGLLRCSDSKRPLQAAEKWLPKHADSAQLLLAIGRQCIQNQQWGRAIDFFEQSIKIQPRTETFAELARLLDYMNEHEKSHAYYKLGLMQNSKVLIEGGYYK
ncbi:MAG: HemY protein [Cellvibrionaceae bacterium]|jgi:HemY protein